MSNVAAADACINAKAAASPAEDNSPYYQLYRLLCAIWRYAE